MSDIYLIDITKPFDIEICKRDFPKRFGRSEKFRFDADKKRCIGVGALLSNVLHITESDFAVTDTGKPYSESANRKFSISHSGDFCVLALDANEIGVDIEKKSLKRLPISEKLFQKDELDFIARNETDNFFALWTMKESVGKLLGKGIAMSLNSFSALPLAEGKPIQIDGRTIYGKYIPLDSYALSVCTENEYADCKIEYIN